MAWSPSRGSQHDYLSSLSVTSAASSEEEPEEQETSSIDHSSAASDRLYAPANCLKPIPYAFFQASDDKGDDCSVLSDAHSDSSGVSPSRLEMLARRLEMLERNQMQLLAPRRLRRKKSRKPREIADERAQCDDSLPKSKSNESTSVPEAEPAELNMLRHEITMLRAQLEEVGARPLEYTDLDTAENNLRTAMINLMEGAVPQKEAEAEVQRWETAVKLHPDFKSREEASHKKWMGDIRSSCEESRIALRSLIPHDIFTCSMSSLIERGLPQPLARRFLTYKILWLLRMHPDDIQRLHEADLISKYSFHGLDLRECQAVLACLPEVFDNDPRGAKARWRDDLIVKVKDLSKKAEQGSAADSTQLLKHSVYRDAERDGVANVFDPNHEPSRLNPVMSQAFSREEVDVENIRALRAGGPEEFTNEKFIHLARKPKPDVTPWRRRVVLPRRETEQSAPFLGEIKARAEPSTFKALAEPTSLPVLRAGNSTNSLSSEEDREDRQLPREKRPVRWSFLVATKAEAQAGKTEAVVPSDSRASPVIAEPAPELVEGEPSSLYPELDDAMRTDWATVRALVEPRLTKALKSRLDKVSQVPKWSEKSLKKHTGSPSKNTKSLAILRTILIFVAMAHQAKAAAALKTKKTKNSTSPGSWNSLQQYLVSFLFSQQKDQTSTQTSQKQNQLLPKQSTKTQLSDVLSKFFQTQQSSISDQAGKQPQHQMKSTGEEEKSQWPSVGPMKVSLTIQFGS